MKRNESKSKSIYKNKKIESQLLKLSLFNIEFYNRIYIFRVRTIKKSLKSIGSINYHYEHRKILFLLVIFVLIRAFITYITFVYHTSDYDYSLYDDINIKFNKELSYIDYDKKICNIENLIKVYINLNDE